MLTILSLVSNLGILGESSEYQSTNIIFHTQQDVFKVGNSKTTNILFKVTTKVFGQFLQLIWDVSGTC